MKVEDIAETIWRSIGKWRRNERRLVVGIEGRTGAGKTTVLKDLARLGEVTPVNIDDFLVSHSERNALSTNQEDMKRHWLSVRWYKAEKVREVITAYREGAESMVVKTHGQRGDEEDREITYNFKDRVLVVEGVYLLLPKLADLWDRLVYLDADEANADTRRIAREKTRWGKKYLPESDPRSRFRAFKTAYKEYLRDYHPEKKADLVIEVDGLES
jgi:uridine kinase